MRLDHLLSKETSGETKISSVTSYWSVQSVKFHIIQFRGYRKASTYKNGDPGKAQRSGFDGERRNKGTVELLKSISKAQVVTLVLTIWGFSSAGRAPALQAGGQRFDPANLHHKKEVDYGPIAQLARAHD